MLDVDIYHNKNKPDKRFAGYRFNKPWRASISLPWYDDSDIECYGDTREEAVRSAREKVEEMRDALCDLLDRWDEEVKP